METSLRNQILQKNYELSRVILHGEKDKADQIRKELNALIDQMLKEKKLETSIETGH